MCSAIRTCIRDSLHCFLYEIKLYEHCLLSGCPMRDLQLVQCTQIFILPIASVFQKKKMVHCFCSPEVPSERVPVTVTENTRRCKAVFLLGFSL